MNRSAHRPRGNGAAGPPTPAPPHSLEAEQAVLGSLLFDSTCWSRVSHLVPADFYRPDHCTIFAAMVMAARAGRAFDVTTLSDELDRFGQLTDAGGLPYLGQLFRETSGTVNVEQYARIVADKAQLRRLWSMADEVRRAIAEGHTAQQVRTALLSTLQVADATDTDALPGEWLSELGDFTPPRQLVEGLLEAGKLIVIFGESNSGKTFLVLDLCMAVAAGVSWRGKRTRKGLVVYIAGEGGASMRGRLSAQRIERPGIADVPFLLVSQEVNFLDPQAIGRLLQTIRRAELKCGERCALVVVDTFARAIAGGDENSAQDVGVVVAAADRIRAEVGSTLAFVHHAGKDTSKGARGSSALRAACDTEILVEGHSDTRTVIVQKQRDLPVIDPMAFELRSVVIGRDPETKADVTSCVLEHIDASSAPPANAIAALRGKAQRQLLAALRERTKDQPGRIWSLFDLRQMGRELGQRKNTARSAVDTLVTSPFMQLTVGGYTFVDGSPKP